MLGRDPIVVRVDPAARKDNRPRRKGHRPGTLHHQDFVGAAAFARSHDDQRGGGNGAVGQGLRTAWLHVVRSEEHTSELQSIMRISYAVFCLKKNNKIT